MEQYNDSSARLVSISDLQNCAADILRRLGHPDEDAATVAQILVDSDLRGYSDHGVSILGVVSASLKHSSHNPRPNVQVVNETESALLLDGDRGFGVMPGMKAMRWCIDHARTQHGIASAAVRNSGSVITLAPFVELPARAGLIGFACVNAEPNVAPPGGHTKVLGTNPLAFGVPARRHYPLIFDMATSGTAAMKIRIAALKGESVPEGLIADAQGRPTTDPNEFWPPTGPMMIGSMLSLGWPHAAHKGFGLAMFVDILAGVLSGSGFAQQASIPDSNVGQFYWALDVSAFMPLDDFLTRVDEQIDQVKASGRGAGAGEILVPGERAQRHRESLLGKGTMPLPPESWEPLENACRVVGIAPPAVVG